jgi:hypothetical protein
VLLSHNKSINCSHNQSKPVLFGVCCLLNGEVKYVTTKQEDSVLVVSRALNSGTNHFADNFYLYRYIVL